MLRDAARLDRTQSDPVVSFRNAIGVAGPLAVGALAGNVGLGLAATIGALQTCFADRPGPYRLRLLRMLTTAVAAGVTSGLAVVLSRSNTGSVLLLLGLAFLAGLLVSGGPSAGQVGTAGTAAAIVLGHLPQPPSVALHVGLLVLLGGAVQTVLAISGWPMSRHRPERIALAKLYRELGGAARAQSGPSSGPPASDTLTDVRQTLYGLGHDHGPSVEAYRVLLDEAERIRREITVLTAAAERLAEERNPILADLVSGALTTAGGVLEEIAAALEHARPVNSDVLDRARTTLRATIDQLLGATETSAELTRRAAASRLRALSGELRAAVESTVTGASEGRRDDQAEAADGLARLGAPVAVVRANLSLDSSMLRHAVRLALLVAGSDLVVRLVGADRGYWVPLTVLVVLRPDFATTWQRSIMRVLGTIVGLFVATVLVHWVPGGVWWQIALITVLTFGMRFAGPGNIGLTAVCLSGLVVVLLEINGVPAHTTVEGRAVATLVGGGLAIAAAVAVPNWERRLVPSRLAELLAAYRRNLDAVAVAIADLGADRGALQRTRAASRRARSNAQASVDRAASEPVPSEAEVELGRTVLSHTHRFIHAVLTIDAVCTTICEAGGVPELTEFLAAAGAALDAAEDAVRSGVGPGPLPELRPLQEEVAGRLVIAPERVGGIETATTLIDATDRIANSLDTLLGELRRQLAITSDV